MYQRAAALLASSALALTASAAPAIATEKDKYFDLKLTVCKKVIGKDEGKKFLIKIHTDKGEAKVYLKDKQCEDVKLKFDKPKVTIKEEDQHGYKLHKFDVPMNKHLHTESYKVEDHKVVVKYQDCDNAKVKVIVVNKKDKKDCGC